LARSRSAVTSVNVPIELVPPLFINSTPASMRAAHRTRRTSCTAAKDRVFCAKE
jgi:hypothetical protein